MPPTPKPALLVLVLVLALVLALVPVPVPAVSTRALEREARVTPAALRGARHPIATRKARRLLVEVRALQAATRSATPAVRASEARQVDLTPASATLCQCHPRARAIAGPSRTPPGQSISIDVQRAVRPSW